MHRRGLRGVRVGDGALGVHDYRDMGILPAALFNYLRDSGGLYFFNDDDTPHLHAWHARVSARESAKA